MSSPESGSDHRVDRELSVDSRTQHLLTQLDLQALEVRRYAVDGVQDGRILGTAYSSLHVVDIVAHDDVSPAWTQSRYGPLTESAQLGLRCMEIELADEVEFAFDRPFAQIGHDEFTVTVEGTCGIPSPFDRIDREVDSHH